MAFESLLLPTDGNDPAEQAARRGFDPAEEFGASVHVLSVADSSIATGAGYSGDSPSTRARLRERAEDRAGPLRDAATERGPDATAAVREGIPAGETVDRAGERGLGAVPVGTSGRGGAARTIVGSVADRVVRTAPAPVVTVRSGEESVAISEERQDGSE